MTIYLRKNPKKIFNPYQLLTFRQTGALMWIDDSALYQTRKKVEDFLVTGNGNFSTGNTAEALLNV
jgi:hypothetical protein